MNEQGRGVSSSELNVTVFSKEETVGSQDKSFG